MSNLYQVTKKVRTSFILNLRHIFSDPTALDRYAYVELPSGEYDFDKTRIVISDSIPNESAFFPAITVNTVVGDEQRYIGPDSYKTTRDNSGNETTDQIFTSIPMTVNIQVHTIDDTKARDEIIDRIYDHFKSTNDELAAAGIEIVRTSFPADARAFNGDRWYITGTITINVYTEWHDDLGPGTNVGKVLVSLSLIP